MRIDTTDVVHRDDIRSCIEQTKPVLVNSDRHGGARDQGRRPETAIAGASPVPRGGSGPAAPTTRRWPTLLGDKSERMGKHYNRHVEAEANVIRAFTWVRDAK